MRVTNNMLYSTLTEGMYSSSKGLLKAQEMLSTGRRLNAPSDDPVSFAIATDYKNIISSLGQYARNIEFAMDYLSESETALSRFGETLTRLRELAMGAATGTADAGTRLATSYEVAQCYDTLIDIGNSKVAGRYLFSGFLVDQQPFDSSGAYSGDPNEASINIGTGSSFTYAFSGDRVFKGAGGGVDIYQIAADFKTALETNDVQGIQDAMGLLEGASSQIGDVISEVGGRQSRVASQKGWIEDFSLDARVLLSGREDADMTEISTALVKHQTALEAVYAATARISGLNIFDFLR